jgi:hypothetical protein
MTGTDDLSRLFAALSHPHRRVVLYYLREQDTATLPALADCVTGWFESGPGGDGERADYDAVKIALHHQHLPMLADAGFVTYDHDDGSVTLAGLSGVADDVLTAALDAEADPGAAFLEGFPARDEAEGR